MTFNIGTNILNFELRYGVGLDIEFCESRPIWGNEPDSSKLIPMWFEGVAIAIPFFLICFGRIGDLNEDEK